MSNTVYFPITANLDTVTINPGFNLHIKNTTQSVGVTGGALIVDGGLGISGDVHVSGNVYTSGDVIGATGATGATGTTGTNGTDGATGATGTTGTNGTDGATGATGATGTTGTNGTNGATGATGATGTITTPTLGATGSLMTYNPLNTTFGYNATLTFSTTSTLVVAGDLVPAASHAYTLGSVNNVWGPAYFSQTGERFSTITAATGTVAHNWADTAVWYHSSISANFTANITNLPTVNNRSYVVVLNLVQGGTAYYANALQVNSSSVSINWVNGTTPTPAANKREIESFTLFYHGSAWSALGQYTSFG